MSRTKSILVTVVCFFLLDTAVIARTRFKMPAATLTEKADLIIIGQFIRTGDAKKSDKPPEPFDKLVGVDSSFKVLSVLKGKTNQKELVLFHFRYDFEVDEKEIEPKLPKKGSKKEKKTAPVNLLQIPDVVDGPSLIRFNPKTDEDARFLMFLKKRTDGRYEAISGQIDPDLSINKLVGASDD